MDIKTQKNLTRASKLAKRGELKEAEKIYNKILQDSPKNQEAKKALAMLDQNMDSARPRQDQIDFVMSLYSSGKIIEAIESINELVQKFPKEPLLYNISGACYLAAEMIQEALKSYVFETLGLNRLHGISMVHNKRTIESVLASGAKNKHKPKLFKVR